jgi:general secretion pathway protein A
MDTEAYLSFFGLHEQPFAPTADPAYFHATRTHKECLFRLWNSIDSRQGIAVVLGNYGTGKTTLLRKLLLGMAADQDKYSVAVIGSPIPSWTSFALLEAVAAQFHLQPIKQSFVDYMESLYLHLLANKKKINTLIIDDAQNLNKKGQLELLRLAQNLETQQHKLLNLMLFSQLEWVDVLRAAPNFEQRINMTYTLAPIRLEETRHFIEFRLRQAGMPASEAIFEEAAIQAVHAYAEGIPRVIVTVCRNAMLTAAHLRSRRVSADIILHTIEKTTVPDPERRARALAVLESASNAAPAREEAPAPIEIFRPVTVEPARDSRTEIPRFAPKSRDDRAAQMLFRAASRRPAAGEERA